MKTMNMMRDISTHAAYHSEDHLFETQHLNDVVYFIEQLATHRKLDKNLAKIIAYGHDLGRTLGGISGKGHADMSATITQALLRSDNHLSMKKQAVILHAIKCHSKKNQFHNAYDELIKDADALAHNLEGMIEASDWREQQRVVVSNLGVVRIEERPIEEWMGRLETLLKEKMDIEPDNLNHWVHQRRIQIREMEGICWYLRTYDPKTFHYLKGVKKRLMSEMKDLEEIRRLHVCLRINEQEDFRNADIERYLLSCLKQAQLNYISTPRKAYDFNENPSFIVETQRGNRIWTSEFWNYTRTLDRVSLDNKSEIHSARIQGKKFKVLNESHLIVFEQLIIREEIETFHKISGDIQDLRDFKKVIEEVDLPSYEQEALLKTIRLKHRQKIKSLKRSLFFFKLLNRYEGQ